MIQCTLWKCNSQIVLLSNSVLRYFVVHPSLLLSLAVYMVFTKILLDRIFNSSPQVTPPMTQNIVKSRWHDNPIRYWQNCWHHLVGIEDIGLFWEIWQNWKCKDLRRQPSTQRIGAEKCISKGAPRKKEKNHSNKY